MSCGCLQSTSKSCGPGLCYPVSGLGALKPSGLGQSSALVGGAASSSALGILEGANVGCVTQAPPSQIVICPAPFKVTIPGPILSTSCEPVRVGGYSACAGGAAGGKQTFICSSSCS